ncbi:MAG: hypothetical protein Q7T40_05865, partial [Methylobacter sp.]|nr:hypothetical protein [Methylobacter sp.]
MAVRTQAIGQLGRRQAVRIFYSPLSFEEGVRKLPEIGEVHVWSARLISTQNKFEVFYGTLSTDERKRAESFVQER